MQIVTHQQMLDSIGHSLPPTDWFCVTQQQIDRFADCTHDHQFIHVDEEKARQTPFGTTIAHGFLTLSMLSYFAESFSLQVEGAVMGINYGFDKVRFLAPVTQGSRIRGIARIKAVDDTKSGQYKVTYDVTIEIKNSAKPALKAEWIGLQLIKK